MKTFFGVFFRVREYFGSICWLTDVSSIKGLPTFDLSSHGHESGLTVPSEGAGNIAADERSRDPGLPGEWGYAEPR